MGVLGAQLLLFNDLNKASALGKQKESRAEQRRKQMRRSTECKADKRKREVSIVKLVKEVKSKQAESRPERK